MEVNSNGDLSPCRDYHDYVVGNIKEATITELWNSPAYRKFRQSLATEGLMPVCSRCCGLDGVLRCPKWDAEPEQLRPAWSFSSRI